MKSVLTLRFIDRVSELETLKALSERVASSPFYLYGPEGSGKTRLLLEFVNSFQDIAIYVNALENINVENALIVSSSISELKNIVDYLIYKARNLTGKYLFENMFLIISSIATRINLSDRRIVITIDNIAEAVGINEVEKYLKWLYEHMRKIWEDRKPRSILMIVVTSRSESLDLVLRHNYVWTRLLWNLDKESTIELVKELNPPEDDVINDIWCLTGGNPRAIIDIAYMFSWSVDTWLRELEKKLARVFLVVESKDLVRELKQVVDDPDNIFHRSSSRMLKLYKILVKENLVVYKYISTLDGKDVPEDSEIGVGTYFAWQLPAYRIIMRRLIGS